MSELLLALLTKGITVCMEPDLDNRRIVLRLKKDQKEISNTVSLKSIHAWKVEELDVLKHELQNLTEEFPNGHP